MSFVLVAIAAPSRLILLGINGYGEKGGAAEHVEDQGRLIDTV